MFHLNFSTTSRLVRLVFTLSVVMGSLIALLSMTQGLSAVGVTVFNRYVNEDGGTDTGDCTNPASPCDSITYGLSQAGSGDSLFVAEGIYTENLTVTMPVSLLGGYVVSGTTWLPGTPGASTINGSSLIGQPVVTFQGAADGAILNGFTVTGGSVITDGGGISINSVSPIIRSCIIKGNTGGSAAVEWGGGGIVVSPDSLAPIISNTLIINNVGTGGASGIRIGQNVTLTMINSVIANNTGRFAIHANGLNLIKMINMTIADQPDMGGILLNGSRAVITNSIIWQPTNTAITAGNGGTYTVTYSDVSDGVPSGAGNLSTDPNFVGSGNYHLKIGSLVIDKGTANGAPIADLEGTLRDARPDMGAYEWIGFRLYLPLVLKNL